MESEEAVVSDAYVQNEGVFVSFSCALDSKNDISKEKNEIFTNVEIKEEPWWSTEVMLVEEPSVSDPDLKNEVRHPVRYLGTRDEDLFPIKSRLRFTAQDDIILLQEVLAANPFENPTSWDEITLKVVNTTHKCFTRRCVKEHLSRLLKLFAKNDNVTLRRFGTEGEYIIKSQLLKEVTHMAQDHFSRKRRRKSPRTVGEILKVGESLENPSPESSSQSAPLSIADLGTTPGKRKKGQEECLVVLENKEKEWKVKELEIEQEKLNLKKRKLDLEEDRFLLEKQERQARLEMKRIESKHKIELEKKQLSVLEKLIILLEKSYS